VVPRRLLRSKGTVELGERVSIVETMGGKAYTHILMSEDAVNMVLMGTATLEALGLEVDPVTGN
jgi:predicted aspartyl protease